MKGRKKTQREIINAQARYISHNIADPSRSATATQKLQTLAQKLEASRQEHAAELDEEYDEKWKTAAAKAPRDQGPKSAAALPVAVKPRPVAKPIECLPQSKAKISAMQPAVGVLVWDARWNIISDY